MPHCKTVFKFGGGGGGERDLYRDRTFPIPLSKENWMCAPVILLMRDWSFTWLLIIWMRCMYSLTQHPFSKSGCRGFAVICSWRCGPHTEPLNLCHVVERVLNIIGVKVSLFTHQITMPGSCPRNKFSWLLIQMLDFHAPLVHTL